jgi:hypothetical protein
MALGELQKYSWVARGWEAMSHFVCLRYSCKAATKIVSNFVEEVAVDGRVRVLVDGRKDMAREDWSESMVIIPLLPESGTLETVTGFSRRRRYDNEHRNLLCLSNVSESEATLAICVSEFPPALPGDRSFGWVL